VLSDIPPQTDPRVLVDFRTSDDAGVYAWESGPALVQTVDFFTPIVDDPYLYGQIAAANSLSDVYAMGGRPLTALAIAGFPEDGLDIDTIRQIFRGGVDALREAGVALLGGHTVRDREIKFGYAVTGAVDPAHMWTNAGARAGDILFLTKPIGTGIIGTAIKFGRAPEAAVELAVASMRTLNKAAAEALSGLDVHACTDITGFGLLGHAAEMAIASNVTVELDADAIPIFEGVRALAAGNRSGGLASNRAHFASRVHLASAAAEALTDVLYDPQTSGGLLVAVGADLAGEAASRLLKAGVSAARVGHATAPSTHALVVR
jgi:selenide,water dikinase